MATIPVNLSNVQAFENLPLGEYEGEIEKIVHMEPREEGKFGQLRAQYTVIDGDQLGRASSEFLSLSPKAAFRLKKWFAKFGDEFADVDDLETDENDELTDPDLVGARVTFIVHEETDKRTKEVRVKTSLISYDGDAPEQPVADDADDDEEDDEEEAPEPPKAVKKAVKVPTASVPARKVASAAKQPRRSLR